MAKEQKDGGADPLLDPNTLMIINQPTVHADLHHAWEVNMNKIRKEVLTLITVNERFRAQH